MILKNELITQKYTYIEKGDHVYNAPHSFIVRSVEKDDMICQIMFQCGPIKESGVNGVNNEDLIAMVIERLNCFQNSEFKCRENAIAATKLEESLMWLRKRTMARESRGAEGTHKV